MVDSQHGQDWHMTIKGVGGITGVIISLIIEQKLGMSSLCIGLGVLTSDGECKV